jgi:ABC-type branched-subunit amino acid transport system permease subunit
MLTLTTISGLPAHVLLVHAVVVLAPLTALLEILCGLWPAARRRLVWLALAFAVVTTVLTPITTEAGEWLYDRESHHRNILNTHADRGGWMIYFSVAMLVVAVALALVHWRESRSGRPGIGTHVAVALLAVAVGAASIVQVVRIGDSGARSVWADELTKSDKP